MIVAFGSRAILTPLISSNNSAARVLHAVRKSTSLDPASQRPPLGPVEPPFKRHRRQVKIELWSQKAKSAGLGRFKVRRQSLLHLSQFDLTF